MHIYTIITDYKEGTYLSQFEGDNPKQALHNWAKKYDLNQIEGMGESERTEVIEELLDEDLMPIKTLSNVWCASSTVNNNLLLIHIVKTNKNAI